MLPILPTPTGYIATHLSSSYRRSERAGIFISIQRLTVLAADRLALALVFTLAAVFSAAKTADCNISIQKNKHKATIFFIDITFPSQNFPVIL